MGVGQGGGEGGASFWLLFFLTNIVFREQQTLIEKKLCSSGFF